ncbi:MAG: 50S ribosomal protein L18 [Actinomycetota bacterium]
MTTATISGRKKAEGRRVARLRRHKRVRKQIIGTPDRPRLSVFRSARHIYAQIVDDTSGRTLVAASTLDTTLKAAKDPKKARAKQVGSLIAERAKGAGVSKVAFDRGGFAYHGRVAQLAEGAREGGLEF